LRKVINCIKDNNPLINKKLKEVSLEEGKLIATELFQILNKRKDGIGLAANQVGIDAQVAVVNVIEPLVLINPKIIRKENEIKYYEGCLSFPKKGVNTTRYETIEVTSEGVEGSMIFSGVETSSEGKGSWETDNAHDSNSRLLESVCVQHEIDHLNGLVCMDRKVETSYKRDTKKIGRNEIVKLIENGHVVTEMKWKKAQKFLSEDRWELYDDWKSKQ
jgi:peptide deformylase